jgi:hypothetical protein
MENAENIPDDIFKETISILHSYPLQNKWFSYLRRGVKTYTIHGTEIK